MSAERWEDARRLEEWAGEARVNLLRAAAVIAFYGQHLLNLYAFHDDLGFAEAAPRAAFHLAVTAVTSPGRWPSWSCTSACRGAGYRRG